jgi:hypothetical protein
MTAFIKLPSLEYPRHEGDIRLEYPTILDDQTGETFPVPANYARVLWIDPPDFDPLTQFLTEAAPIEVDGVWSMVWCVNDLSQETLDRMAQEKMNAAAKRNPKLLNSGSAPDVIG